jgi:ubiquinone/menaquinone biosynthesis C-methylase UbiE
VPNDKHNREAWNKLSNPTCPWSIPVTNAEIVAAKSGDYVISVAGMKPIPPMWLGDVSGKSILCLASGGGQQAPILSAAGANVTLLDISDEQLELDRKVCAEHSLSVDIVQGTMTDLSRFADASFDIIVNPVSNSYVFDLVSVWKECYRVLNDNGRLVSGSINPVNFLFEENEGKDSRGLKVVNSLPYAESESLTESELEKAISRKMVFTWSHSLEEIIQGQISVGFLLAGMFESRRKDMRAPSINRYTDTYISTLAVKIKT